MQAKKKDEGEQETETVTGKVNSVGKGAGADLGLELNPSVWRVMEPVHESHGRKEPQGLGWHPGRRMHRDSDQAVSVETDRRTQGRSGACSGLKFDSKTE